MKVNFNKSFIDYSGQEVKGKNIAEHLCLNLFNLSKIAGQPLPPEKKYMAYSLCNRISSNSDCVEITIEEAGFLKEVANEAFNAGAYGQIVDLIEDK